MNNLITTLCIGDQYYNKFGKHTIKTMKHYANKFNNDFLCLDKPKFQNKIKKYMPYFEKFQIYDLFDDYDRILFIDIDAFFAPKCPDLFEIVKYSDFGAWDVSTIVNKNNQILQYQKKFGDIKWKKSYFNCGVMVLSKHHKKIFKINESMLSDPIIKKQSEQTYMNYNRHKFGFRLHDIGYKFNHTFMVKKDRFKSYIIHHASKSFGPTIKDDIHTMYGATL